MFIYKNTQTDLIVNTEQFTKLMGNLELKDKVLGEVPKDKCEIIVNRHAESESNAFINVKDEVRIAGRKVNSPLSDRGFEQAQKLGELLKSKKCAISAFYSSSLQRAIDTATKIRDTLKSELKIVPEDSFLETHYGLLEGATGHKYDPSELEMKQTLPKLKDFEARMEYHLVVRDEHNQIIGDIKIENNKQVYKRVVEAILELAKKHLGQRISITTHNGPLKALFMHLLARDWNAEVMYHQFSVGNCAALCLESDGKDVSLKAIHNITMR